MEYAVAICDDSDVDRRSIGGMVRRWAEEAGCSVRIDGFPSAESFLFEYDRNKGYDILLLVVLAATVSAGIVLVLLKQRKGLHSKKVAPGVYIYAHSRKI